MEMAVKNSNTLLLHYFQPVLTLTFTCIFEELLLFAIGTVLIKPKPKLSSFHDLFVPIRANLLGWTYFNGTTWSLLVIPTTFFTFHYHLTSNSTKQMETAALFKKKICEGTVNILKS